MMIFVVAYINHYTNPTPTLHYFTNLIIFFFMETLNPFIYAIEKPSKQLIKVSLYYLYIPHWKLYPAKPFIDCFQTRIGTSLEY